MHRFIFAAAAALLASQAVAQPSAPPKLVVQIAINGLTPQLLAEYRPMLTGGLARIANEEPSSPAGARTIVVAGSNSSALALSAAPDQRWYWSGNRYETDLHGNVPASIAAANAAIAREIATAQPALVPPPECLAKAGGTPASAFARPAGDAAAFHQSPEGDGATLAVSAALVRELGLGRGTAPDMLKIGLSGAGDVGRKYGAGGQEMCLELLSLDRDLGDFLGRLDSWGLNYRATLDTH